MNMMELQVKALRAVAVATVAGCDVFLSMMAEAEADAAPPSPPVEQKVFDPDPAKCQHPRTHWQRRPVMGKPNRYICGCGTEMEETNS